MYIRLIFVIVLLFSVTACQTGNTNLDGSFRLQSVGVSAEAALQRGLKFCVSQGRNFEGAIEALRAAGYTIQTPKVYGSKSETSAFDPEKNVNFQIITNKIGRRACDIQFRYDSGISSLPKIGTNSNGKTSWDLDTLDTKLRTDIASSPMTEQISRKLARSTQNLTVYTGTEASIRTKTFVHPDGYALGILKILAPLPAN